MRTSAAAVLAIGLIACGKGDKDKAAPGSTAAAAGPIEVRFGDCAGATVGWVSGPKPLPFTADEAAGILAVANPASLDDPPPPEEEDKPDDGDDASGGTGTALALDEGKMGKKDSDRAEGQYKMKKLDDDPQLARQRAIEQARAAGILGNPALQQGGAFASLTASGDIGGFDEDIYGGLLGNEASGAVGWGTIGTGRYGTIGYGSGAGVGGRPRRSAVPTVSIGQANAQGDLDKAIIRRYVRRTIPKIQYCYEKQLLVKPGLAGTVSTQFFIGPDGEVKSSVASGVDPEVATCVAGVIKNIEFPKPKGGGGVQVNYPFTFRPGGDYQPPQATASAPPAPDPAPPAAARPSPPPAPKTPRSLVRGPTQPPLDATNYRPGDKNPLRGESTALEACLRTHRPAVGVAVVELSYDAAGAVTKASVHGLEDDAAVRECVAGVAKRVKRMTDGATAERCSLAYGEMPDSTLDAIDISADASTYRGKPYTLAQGERTSLALVTMLATELAPILADKGPVVSVRAPRVVRPIDAAKMRDVNAAIASVIVAGDDVVLAARRGAEWKLFTPMTLPVIPVPFGTGGRWFPIRTRALASGTRPAEDETVMLSVLAEKDRTWIGLSRVNEFQEIPNAEVATRLVTLLKEHKASAFFADRVDIEIAGSDDATYGQLLLAIDAAAQAGFTAWQFSTPDDLSARPRL